MVPCCFTHNNLISGTIATNMVLQVIYQYYLNLVHRPRMKLYICNFVSQFFEFPRYSAFLSNLGQINLSPRSFIYDILCGCNSKVQISLFLWYRLLHREISFLALARIYYCKLIYQSYLNLVSTG